MPGQSIIRRGHTKECPIENTLDTLIPLSETVDDHPHLNDQVEDGGADAGQHWVVVEEGSPRCNCSKLAVKMGEQLKSLIASVASIMILNLHR